MPNSDEVGSNGYVSSHNPALTSHGDGLSRTKLQPPTQRRSTLLRPRLLDWMEAKTKGRLTVISAEAGYGKTTLLADFTQRTRLRVLWLRIDDLDADLVTFVAYLVAAGKEHRPGFGEATLALLAAGNWKSRIDALAASFLSELHGLGLERAVLVLDDFHLVDHSRDVLQFVSSLIRRADAGLAVVISTRRFPNLHLGRLRAQGEVAELGREDLRFHPEEASRLFKEVYGRDLEAEAILDLSGRTEGWAASLQLVHAATQSMSAAETRTFIHGLTGDVGDIHDFLAEEVVEHLGQAERDFIMRLALLVVIDEETAQLVSGVPEDALHGLLAAAEKAGLLSRRGTGTTYKLHPLVQQFLQARLLRSEGEQAINEMHLRVATAMESRDWNVACWHYAAAGRHDAVRRVLSGAATRIMSSGSYATASRYMGDELAPDTAVSALVMSRQALASHDLAAATALARRAVELADVDHAALGNLVSVLIASGELAEARRVAALVREQASETQLRQVADVTTKLIDSSVDGDLHVAAVAASNLATQSRDVGAARYEAIGWLNAGEAWRAIGRPREALAAATQARDLLANLESGGEWATAASVRAWSLALTDGLAAAREEFAKAAGCADGATAVEVLAEFALVEALYGEATEASRLTSAARARRISRTQELSEKVALAELVVCLRRQDVAGASDRLNSIRPGAFSAQPGRDGLRLVLGAHLALLRGDPETPQMVSVALSRATDQGCEWLVPYCHLLRALSNGLSEAVVAETCATYSAALGPLAEVLFRPDHILSSSLAAKIAPEIARFPERWLGALRAAADEPTHRSRLVAAQLLERIGQQEDVVRLRRIAKAIPGNGSHRDLGRALARRLAPRVFLEDQGRVSIHVDGVEVPSRRVRRKVLALVCFLLTKPRFSAPRDEVLDSLWPEMSPIDALNSLNQTVYFLRRVFEPKFVEDLSPGYISHESELIWLDTSLIGSRSALCSAAIAGLSQPPTPAEVERLAGLYRDRFALDFAYEEWAGSYRDTQHAAYLRAVEQAVRLDAQSGHFQRGAELARRALAIDPGADEVEEALLRLYRQEGANAAAAEQYAHYSGAIQNALDVDAPPLESF